MKDKFTYEVGDSVLIIGEEVAVCPDIYGDIIYVDLTYAILRLPCRDERENKWRKELYFHQGGLDETISRELVLSLLGNDYECGEYDLFFDMYSVYKWGYKAPSHYLRIYLNDNDGNQISYYDIKESDYIAYCGVQVLDQIRYFKLFGEPAPGYPIFPLTDKELIELNLSSEGNYYKVPMSYPKELFEGVWTELYFNGAFCMGYIVYSHGNKAVIKGSIDHGESIEGIVDFLSSEDLSKMPGVLDSLVEDAAPGEEFIAFDQITGETEEQFKSMDVIADDGTVLTGEIRGYLYVGRKIVGRYLCFYGEEDTVAANRLFADRTDDNKYMCQKIDSETTYYYFGLSENETIRILH